MTLLPFVLAMIWGMVWAVYLQTGPGRFLAARYTWITVVIGVGGDLLIGLLVISFDEWLKMVVIVALSAIGIVARSLRNEHQDQVTLTRMVNGDENANRQ